MSILYTFVYMDFWGPSYHTQRLFSYKTFITKAMSLIRTVYYILLYNDYATFQRFKKQNILG